MPTIWTDTHRLSLMASQPAVVGQTFDLINPDYDWTQPSGPGNQPTIPVTIDEVVRTIENGNGAAEALARVLSEAVRHHRNHPERPIVVRIDIE